MLLIALFCLTYVLVIGLTDLRKKVMCVMSASLCMGITVIMLVIFLFEMVLKLLF